MEGGSRAPVDAVSQVAERVWRVGKLVFRADFDSGNLGGVYATTGADGAPAVLLVASADCCAGGGAGSGSGGGAAGGGGGMHIPMGAAGGGGGGAEYRVWYFFGIGGLSRSERVSLVIAGLNPVAKVYNADMRPCAAALRVRERACVFASRVTLCVYVVYVWLCA